MSALTLYPQQNPKMEQPKFLKPTSVLLRSVYYIFQNTGLCAVLR